MTAGAFEAATGDGPAPGAGDASGARRAAEVRVAFEGLMQIRRLTNTEAGDPEAVPAAWETNQVVRSVALALEAAGYAPSAVDADGARTATGYRVGAGERAGTARVEWLGPPGDGAAQEEHEALTGCATELCRLGWTALLYRGPRRRRFLEVEPPAGGEHPR
ncbi:hypothetical protein AR457_05020 [Streptomyces agglomeratus]|uniref:hypothetical protein n=1 Tax=Streptomyces agglomeratus TaxID=285458 RepID=UPI000854FB87|nr:hypothetical protein [Streptomyces agglomeratus]OEJ43549.1 hypothetical protein AR457_05020 [Streptomyces agglomeratus]OEJ61904.1 hypothetical protein BGM19_31670 [Streptomyces agglomeratus]